MKKFFGTILLLSVVVLVFSAGVLAEEEIELTIAAGSVGQELELTQEAAERFEEEHPNVKVEVLDTPELADDRRGLYLQYLEAESSKVDVYQVDVIWPGELASHFVDLNEYGADEVTDKHFDAIIENNTVDGELVAIPWFT
ncbi:MAG: ABC transporter substrate-binding protein, partial [Halanaerobiales bacterium]